MANEAIFLNVSELDNRQVEWGSTSTVLKGTLIVLADDPNKGDIHRSINTVPLGFSVEEKTTDDTTKTSIGVKVRGDVDAVADGTITLGRLVVPGSVVNTVAQAPTSLSGVGLTYVLGRCLETASDAEVVRIRLMLG